MILFREYLYSLGLASILYQYLAVHQNIPTLLLVSSDICAQVDWLNYTAIDLLRLLDFVLKSWMSTLLVSYLMLHFDAPG
jgi:hypothetical protein